MSENNKNNSSLSLKNAFSAVKNWFGFAFGLFIGVSNMVITLVNNSLKKSEKPTINIPFWVWIIVTLILVMIGVCVIFVVHLKYEHHFVHHSNGTACDDRLKELDDICKKNSKEMQDRFSQICKDCERMQGKRVKDCQDVIDKINLKIEQQNDYLLSVDNLVANAQKLERLYANAVSECLRTNKQVAAIEAEAKPNTEIFIMTSSFLFERFDSDMRNSIVENINKGVKYRYIIPEGTDNDFAQMVYAILADKSLKQNYRNMNTNDFFTATRLKKEYFMLTIAYYEINSESLSEVIVKLPADTLDEVAQEKPLTYLVPKGSLTTHGKKKYNSEHKLFLDNLSSLYNIGRKENGGVIKLTAKQLKQKFPYGVDIAPNQRVYLD